MSSAVLISTPEQTSSSQGITVSFLNSQNQQPVFFNDDDSSSGLNLMELSISNSSNSPILFNYLSDISVENLSKTPILIQIDNMLTVDEISSASLKGPWFLKTLQKDGVSFWAIAPYGETIIQPGDSLTISFNEIKITKQIAENGQVLTQLYYNNTSNAEFQQNITLKTPPKTPLNDVLSVAFTKGGGQREGNNVIYITPEGFESEIDNTLVLSLTNKKEEPLLVNPSQTNEAGFYLSFPVDSGTSGTGLADKDGLNHIDIQIAKISEQDYSWSVQKNTQKDLPFWELQPLNSHILNGGGGVTFNISDIIPDNEEGTTQLTLQPKNILGYANTPFIINIKKMLPEVLVDYFHFSNGDTNYAVLNGGDAFTINYGIFNQDSNFFWEIKIKDDVIINVNQLFGETGYKKGGFTYTMYEAGTFPIVLSCSYNGKILLSKTIFFTAKEYKGTEIRYFAFSNGIINRNFNAHCKYWGTSEGENFKCKGIEEVTLKWAVLSHLDVDWIITKKGDESSSGVIHSFTSHANVVNIGHHSYTPSVSGFSRYQQTFEIVLRPKSDNSTSQVIQATAVDVPKN